MWWNQVEVEDIFRKLEAMEVAIFELQENKD